MFVENGHDQFNFITGKINIKHLKLKTQTATSSNYHGYHLQDPK